MVLLAAMALGACYLTPTDTATAGLSGGGDTAAAGDGATGGFGASASGMVEDGDLRLYWSWYGNEEWENGTCVAGMLKNKGSSALTWSAEVGLDAAVTNLVFSDGAFVFPVGDTLFVEPLNAGSLGAGERVAFNYCAEPRAKVVSLSATTTSSGGSSGGGTDSGGSSGGGADTGGSTDPWEPSLYGSLTAGTGYILTYRDTGTYEDGVCLEMILSNRTGEDVANWAMDVVLDGDTDVIYGWGWEVIGVAGAVYTLAPAAGDTLVNGYGFQGTLCLDPLREPLAFTVHAR